MCQPGSYSGRRCRLRPEASWVVEVLGGRVVFLGLGVMAYLFPRGRCDNVLLGWCFVGFRPSFTYSGVQDPFAARLDECHYLGASYPLTPNRDQRAAISFISY